VLESIILLLPPACPLLLQYYCTSIAQYTTPPPTPLWYAIHHTILVIAISCKGQGGCRGRRRSGVDQFLGQISCVGDLALTRYSFTYMLLCMNQSSFYCPSHLHRPHSCNTIPVLLRNIRPPFEPPFSRHTPYNIVHCNIV